MNSTRLILCLSGWVFALGALANENPLNFPPKSSVQAATIRGESVYKRYCILCHGVNADGQGRAARQYDPKPANLTASPYPAAYKEMVIRRGGEAMGRSKFMPPWEQELTGEQIADLLVYLDSIVRPPQP